MIPKTIWVKIKEDGSLGRAYEGINHTATPPPGVRYAKFLLDEASKIHGEETENSNQDTETDNEVSESTSSDKSVQGQDQIYSEGEAYEENN